MTDAQPPVVREGRIGLVPARFGEGMVGGAEIVLHQMAKRLQDRGWDVEILTTTAMNHHTWESELPAGESVSSLGLTGHEVFDLAPLEDGARTLHVKAGDVEFDAAVRIDTPNEWQYYRHGGILHFVLRQLLSR